jgi:hypothetical protein
VTLEAGRPLLLLLLLLLLQVPLGEITPRWWWWRRDRWRWWWWRRARWWWWRRTNVPLRALGLGAGLLGPTSSPLTVLGGPKQATHQRDAAGVASLPPTPRYHLGRGATCRSLASVHGAGGHSGTGTRSPTGGLVSHPILRDKAGCISYMR